LRGSWIGAENKLHGEENGWDETTGHCGSEFLKAHPIQSTAT